MTDQPTDLPSIRQEGHWEVTPPMIIVFLTYDLNESDGDGRHDKEGADQVHQDDQSDDEDDDEDQEQAPEEEAHRDKAPEIKNERF